MQNYMKIVIIKTINYNYDLYCIPPSTYVLNFNTNEQKSIIKTCEIKRIIICIKYGTGVKRLICNVIVSKSIEHNNAYFRENSEYE